MRRETNNYPWNARLNNHRLIASSHLTFLRLHEGVSGFDCNTHVGIPMVVWREMRHEMKTSFFTCFVSNLISRTHS